MTYSVPERFAGRKIKCKSCGKAIPVPDGNEFADEDDDEFAAFGRPAAFKPASLPPRPGQSRSRPAAAASKSSGGNWMKSPMAWLGAIAGAVVLGLLVCCGGPLLYLKSLTSNVSVAAYPDLPDFGAPTDLFPVAQIPVPGFPELGPGTPLGEKGVKTFEVDLSRVPGNSGSPGKRMQIRVYLPPGDHAPGTLPCVLVAPAGSTLIEGMALDDSGYHDETLPYAEAGFAVVHYSIDPGSDLDDKEDVTPRDWYLYFRAACAGVVNTRNALEFALAKLPMVNPKQIYTAGHSSAGTLALLAAEHEPRIAGAVAYAPATDVENQFKEMAEMPLIVGMIAPRLKEFATQSSPKTHINRINCPVFLFHAKADDNVEFSESEQFVSNLRAAGKEVTFEVYDGAAAEMPDLPAAPVVPPGFPEGLPSDIAEPDAEFDEDWEDYESSHYAPMISDGIPRAILWLKQKTGT